LGEKISLYHEDDGNARATGLALPAPPRNCVQPFESQGWLFGHTAKILACKLSRLRIPLSKGVRCLAKPISVIQGIASLHGIATKRAQQIQS
jgi:hypothetical protein